MSESKKATKDAAGQPTFEFNFIGNRRFLYMLALLTFVGAPTLLMTRGLNYGLDFTGGSEYRFRFNREVGETEIKKVLSEKELSDRLGIYMVQKVLFQGEATGSEFLIRTPEDLSSEKTMQSRLTDALKKGLEDAGTQHLQTSIIGPVVGESLRTDTRKAIFFAVIIILLYMWMRFDIKPGVTSTIALFHDTLAVLGAVSLFQYVVDITTVAAVLTVLGYSLNDSIVILDRVRENGRLKKKMPYPEMINLSLNQCLTRTIYTSLTTLLTLVTLFLLGPEVLQNFAFTLMIGIISGTLSTVCIVTPLLVDWYFWDNPQKKEQMKESEAKA